MTETRGTGVILCECHGRLERDLLDDIRAFLQSQQPGLPVVTTDDLCRPRALSGLLREHSFEAVVVGACSQVGTRLGFWEEPDAAAVSPFCVRTVDLLRETESRCSPAHLNDRMKLLLWAQVKRQTGFSGVPEEALKPEFTRPQGEITRRNLFQMLLPRYRVIPYIQPDKCAGSARCRVCRDSCPCGAITTEGNVALIDRLECEGCGGCVAACPRQAITFPTFSLDQLEGEMEALLLAGAEWLKPRLIGICCQTCLSSVNKSDTDPFSRAPNVLPMQVPCLAMVSPRLMLRAFDLGAQGLALVHNRQVCRLGLWCDRWRGRIQFVQQLLETWGIEPGRVRDFDRGVAEPELSRFAHDVALLSPLSIGPSQPTPLTTHLSLPSLVSSLTNRLAASSGHVISAGSVPFGRLELDRSQCTGCGLCALDCPTAALRIASNADSIRLLFEHQSCVGCGQCVKACPEECLRLENVLDLDRLKGPAENLLEDGMVMCTECGAAVAPRAMIDSLRSKLDAGGAPWSQLEVCPACRSKSVFGSNAILVGAQ